MEKKFDLSGASVHIGIPCYADVPPQTAVSLVETTLALTMEGIPFNLDIQFGCCYVDQVRDFIAHSFLKGGATHLFMVDADMGWRGADFLRVLAHATVNPCVAATYRMKVDDEKYTVNIPDVAAVNEHNCIPATGMGLGFCCVQRPVIEALARKAPSLTMGGRGKIPHVFRCDASEGFYRGEDIAFFADLIQMGVEPWLDLEVELDHYGRKNYRGSFRAMLEARQQQLAEAVSG